MITVRKLLVCLLSLLLLAALLTGCSTVVIDTEQYQVTRKGGQHYFTFKDLEAIKKLDRYGEDEPGRYAVYFDSLEDLLDTFRNGTFSDKEYYTIGYLQVIDDTNNEIFDIENLVEPVPPSPVTFECREIEWRNETLLYWGFDGLTYCCFYVNPEDTYDTMLSNIKKEIENRKQRYDVSIEYDSERDATVYIERDKGPPCETRKRIYYYINTSTKSMFVREVYDHEGDDVPTAVLLNWKESGKSCSVRLELLEERPSVEWLSQFGIQKYEG